MTSADHDHLFFIIQISFIIKRTGGSVFHKETILVNIYMSWQ